MGSFISRNSVAPQLPLSLLATNAVPPSERNATSKHHKVNTLVPDPQATSPQIVTTFVPNEPLTRADLHVHFLKAVKREDIATMETLLLQYQVLRPPNSNVLEDASKENAWEELVNVRGMWESTPLISAAQYAHCDAALWLLNHGANPHARNEKAVTALLLASLEGLTPLVKRLLESADSNSTIQSIDEQIGAVYNSAADVNLRLSPLLAASINGHADVVRLLLDHGADVDQQVVTTATLTSTLTDGSTALLLASRYGHANVVTLLLERKADLTLRDRATKSSALLVACEHGQENCGLLLLQAMMSEHQSRRSSDIETEGWQAMNHQGFTPLHYAAANGLLILCQALLTALNKQQQNFEDEVLATAFINARAGPRQESALLLAVRKRRHDVAQLLLEAGADAEMTDRDGNTAMQVLVRNKQDALLQLASNKLQYQVNVDHVSAFSSRKEEELREAETHDRKELNASASGTKILTNVDVQDAISKSLKL